MKLVSVMLAAFDVPLSATNTNKVCELPQVLHLILLKWPFFLGQFSLVRKKSCVSCDSYTCYLLQANSSFFPIKCSIIMLYLSVKVHTRIYFIFVYS
jgi:hypothetical protein